jgi:two-component system, chemotaxis family, chemotaxis protein CheY
MASILAVDDSEPMRKIIKLALESAGHDLKLGVDGKDALSLFSQGKFDLIITDINMPIMDGIAFAKEIRKLDDDIPILALTTEGSEEQRANGETAGVDGWIVKPFKPAQFLAIIKQVLE